jgi:diadenosine tetraphosphate (Ap4A) HIT family hydrolase
MSLKRPMSSWKMVLRVRENPKLSHNVPCDTDVYVGRGDLGMEDARYSRKQMLFRVEGSTGHATVERCGVNPAFVKDVEQGEDWMRLEQGREYCVQHGTSIKPLLIGPELVVELQSEAAVQPAAKKLGKVVPCQYGAACYRLGNEEHCAKYSHPNVNEINRVRETSVLEVVPVATPARSPAELAGQAALMRAGEEDDISLETPSKNVGATYSASWQDALWPMCAEPEKFSAEVLQYTDRVVVIRDKFPKAKYHYLVLPRAKIPKFKDVKPEHVSYLREMLGVAEVVAKKIGVECRLGFHMKPSMNQIHLHVISDDMDSECLKNKKHWNSFCSEFFVPPSVVIDMLEDDGRIWFDEEKAEKLLTAELKCHRCRMPQANLPKLKAHIAKCKG